MEKYHHILGSGSNCVHFYGNRTNRCFRHVINIVVVISMAKCSDRHYILPQIISLPCSDVHYSVFTVTYIYRSVPGNHPLPGKRPCTKFQGVTVAAFIQTIIVSMHACMHTSFISLSTGAEPLYLYQDLYGMGTGPILYGYLNCVGTESTLARCSTYGSYSGASHSRDAGVKCQRVSIGIHYRTWTTCTR